MNLRPLLLPLLLLFCLAACKKAPGDSEVITFPRKLYVVGVATQSAIRVFTATNDITDPALKNKFLGQQQGFFNMTIPAGDTSSITFLNRDTMMFNPVKTKYEVFKRDNLFLFTSPNYQINISGPSDVLYTFLQYTGAYVSYPLTSGGTGYLSKEVDAAHGDYNTLTLSVLTYKLTSGPYPGTYKMFAGSVFNEFNAGAALNMGKNDTLAIQQSTITFKVR